MNLEIFRANGGFSQKNSRPFPNKRKARKEKVYFNGRVKLNKFYGFAGACIRNFLAGVHKDLRLAGARPPSLKLRRTVLRSLGEVGRLPRVRLLA